jgi:hypothetical protein
MTTDYTASPTVSRERVPVAVRGAQLLFLVPLGALQLVACLVFTITLPLTGAEYLVSGWAIVMSTAGIAIGLRLGRGGAWTLRVGLALLAAQTAFSVLKLTVYGESTSYVFFGFIAACAALLALPASRGHFATGRPSAPGERRPGR